MLVVLRKARRRGGDADKRTKDEQVALLLSIDRSQHIVSKVLAADTALDTHFKSWVIGNMKMITHYSAVSG
jgi:thymidylate kinase